MIPLWVGTFEVSFATVTIHPISYYPDALAQGNDHRFTANFSAAVGRSSHSRSFTIALGDWRDKLTEVYEFAWNQWKAYVQISRGCLVRCEI